MPKPGYREWQFFAVKNERVREKKVSYGSKSKTKKYSDSVMYEIFLPEA